MRPPWVANNPRRPLHTPCPSPNLSSLPSYTSHPPDDSYVFLPVSDNFHTLSFASSYSQVCSLATGDGSTALPVTPGASDAQSLAPGNCQTLSLTAGGDSIGLLLTAGASEAQALAPGDFQALSVTASDGSIALPVTPGVSRVHLPSTVVCQTPLYSSGSQLAGVDKLVSQYLTECAVKTRHVYLRRVCDGVCVCVTVPVCP